MLFRISRTLRSLFLGAARSLAGQNPKQAPARADDARLIFFKSLPPRASAILADDIKLLIGWVSEAASMATPPGPGQPVDSGSTFSKVPGFTTPTDMRPLVGNYTVAMPPLIGPGYYGLALTLGDDHGEPAALLLVNRLFRLPSVLRDPSGVLVDIFTVGALLVGVRTSSVVAATKAARAAFERARELGVPLITAGQSLAGGIAQYQIATLVHSEAEQPIAGFLTFNAAHVAASIERLDFEPTQVPGLNFSKELDPGVGPCSLLPNRVGIQVYISQGGKAAFEPGPSTLLAAVLHPREHLLRSFDRVDLCAALRDLKLLDD